jgi:hypothetical protein
VSPAIPSITEAARLRAAIARDQTSHWRRLFWKPARTKRELERRERMWFWRGGIRFQSLMATRAQVQRGFDNER